MCCGVIDSADSGVTGVLGGEGVLGGDLPARFCLRRFSLCSLRDTTGVVGCDGAAS